MNLSQQPLTPESASSCKLFEYNLAGVAELADAPDSKSGGRRLPCGFDPRLRHHRLRVVRTLSRAQWQPLARLPTIPASGIIACG